MVDFSDSGSKIIERVVEISEEHIVEEELIVNADNMKDIFELERYFRLLKYDFVCMSVQNL